MDVDTKIVETDALGQKAAIAKELRTGREYIIQSLDWRISLMQPVPVNIHGEAGALTGKQRNFDFILSNRRLNLLRPSRSC